MVIQIQRIVILVTCIFFLSDDKKNCLGAWTSLQCFILQTNTGKLMIS